jgi:Cof subfamily protein (haloacid dehalogenase superfamily)
MYKLIALDMDGTLLNNDKQISKENLVALKKAKNLGVKIVLCTGRAHPGVERYVKELGLITDEQYSSTCSGAYVINNTKNNILKSDAFSLEDIKLFSQMAKDVGIAFNMFSGNELLYYENSFFSYHDVIANNLTMNRIELENIKEDMDVYKITLINEHISVKESILNIFMNTDEKEMNRDIDIHTNEKFNKNLFDDLSFIPDNIVDKFTFLKTSPYTIEVISKKANKGEGVKTIADKFGIEKEEVICIGDSGNDKHMIEYAGLGVAMGNAFEEIKEIADYVTYDNENDGVAHIVNKFILS